MFVFACKLMFAHWSASMRRRTEVRMNMWGGDEPVTNRRSHVFTSNTSTCIVTLTVELERRERGGAGDGFSQGRSAL